MKEKINLLIAEPWNFTSSDGNNILKCKIIRKTIVDSFVVIICKCTSVFTIGVDKIEYIGLVKRGNIQNEYNVYKITNESNIEVESSILKKENFIHIMIGTSIDSDIKL